MLKSSIVISTLTLSSALLPAHAEELKLSDFSDSIYCFIGNRFGSQPGTLERGWVCIPEYKKPAVMTQADRLELTAQMQLDESDAEHR